ncbi:hypothetical protein [Mesobacillus thioparans]|uniref:hypothetical protein n=1 Tax=Mesobacillus thioparans TaxID=370439 RepID=UPI0039EF75A8
MRRLAALTEMFVTDVNKEDSVIVEFFGSIVNKLFKVFQVAGIPFLIYVLLVFSGWF